MWIYEKKLQYPVKIKNPNPTLAQIIISQLVVFVNYFIWVKSRKICCHIQQDFVFFYRFTAYSAEFFR